jgi:hypothetical protein
MGMESDEVRALRSLPTIALACHRGCYSRQYHITRPLAPPYSLHTVLLKVESYNRAGRAELPLRGLVGLRHRQERPPRLRGAWSCGAARTHSVLGHHTMRHPQLSGIIRRCSSVRRVGLGRDAAGARFPQEFKLFMEVLTKAARDRRRSDRAFAAAQVCQSHIARPLAPPYNLHTALLKVKLYNGATQDARHDDLLDELDGHHRVPPTPHLCAAPRRCAASPTASHHCTSPPLSPRGVVLDPPCRNSAPRHDRRR